jgi:hypothetical protein
VDQVQFLIAHMPDKVCIKVVLRAAYGTSWSSCQHTASGSGGPRLKFGLRLAILFEVSCGFSQSLRVDDGTVLYACPGPLSHCLPR